VPALVDSIKKELYLSTTRFASVANLSIVIVANEVYILANTYGLIVILSSSATLERLSATVWVFPGTCVAISEQLCEASKSCRVYNLSLTAALLDVLLLIAFTTTVLSHSNLIHEFYISLLKDSIALMTASNSLSKGHYIASWSLKTPRDSILPFATLVA
jgi:hypothetical protein